MPNPRIAKIKALLQEKAEHMARTKPTFWKPAKLIQRLRPPAKITAWLLTKDSLTARIKKLCPDMQVVVLSEQVERPLLDEAKALNMAINEEAWVRCVLLRCGNKDWVYARTVIPNLNTDNPWNELQKLGNKPLGEVLFELPNIQRTEFEYSAQFLNHWPQLLTNLSQTNNKTRGFARRSRFSQQQAPLLLTEVFLPELP